MPLLSRGSPTPPHNVLESRVSRLAYTLSLFTVVKLTTAHKPKHLSLLFLSLSFDCVSVIRLFIETEKQPIPLLILFQCRLSRDYGSFFKHFKNMVLKTEKFLPFCKNLLNIFSRSRLHKALKKRGNVGILENNLPIV